MFLTNNISFNYLTTIINVIVLLKTKKLRVLDLVIYNNITFEQFYKLKWFKIPLSKRNYYIYFCLINLKIYQPLQNKIY